MSHFFDDAFYGSSPAPVAMPCIQLNQPLTPFLRHAWSTAQVRICADGGANRLFVALQEPDRSQLRPLYICGDMDSVRPDVLQFYTALGAQVCPSGDQDTNDLDKALSVLRQCAGEGHCDTCGPQSTKYIIVDGGLGGRMDHVFGNFDVLLRAMDLRIALCCPSCVSIVLPPGRHHIRRNPRHETKKCGIIPLAAPTKNVTSRGLRWELDGLDLRFGVVVSSCNEFQGDELEITTDVPLVWSNVLKTDSEE
eukprot:GGOE01014418.1.p1 GENE.GGOE01014418.1~~GGOE01014418.1.p1  ORF type:complete len:269 (+),score=67.99 GGOE01014418.1:56-808(+)